MNRTVSTIMFSLLLLSTFAVAVVVQPVGAERRTWTVDDDGPSDFHTIQDAIDAAYYWDTIFVKAGTYYENVLVNKPLVLIGENASSSQTGTIIDGSGKGTVLHVEANNCEIRGFTIRNSGDSDWDCGLLVSSSRNIIRDNIVTDNRNGIFLHFTANGNILTRNVVNANIGYGINVWDVSDIVLNENNVSHNYDGIIVEGGSNVTMKNNAMSQNVYNFGLGGWELSHFINDIDTTNKVDGKSIQYLLGRKDMVIDSTWDVGCLFLINSLNVTIKDLVIDTPSWSGIELAYTTNSRIENVKISRTSYAIHLWNSSNNIIMNSEIFNRNGIRLWYSDSNAIVDNRIWWGGMGVLVFYSTNNTISGNSIVGNWRGLDLVSSNNRIFHNNFIDNYVQVYTENGYSNVWNAEYPYGGNYWSDYTGVDSYSGPLQNMPGFDGIGDAPYVIDANNRDSYPLVDRFHVRDVAVLAVDPFDLEIYAGETTEIEVTVRNEGEVTETFDVSCKSISGINEHLIGTQTVTNLAPYAWRTLTFNWTPTEPSVHRLEVVASSVSGEVYTADNMMISPTTVRVKILGDVNNDDRVDMRDLAEAALSFGKDTRYPEWNPVVDINHDGRVDIRDLVLIAKNFGKSLQ